jgi:hypothetical protein
MKNSIIISAVLLSAPWLSAQNKPDAPVDSGILLRTETRMVLVDTIVTNKKGEYIRDLEAKDFKVYEDGKEQKVKSFSFEADPQSPNHADAHYLVLFFDNSTMDLGDQARARQAAVKFIDANAGADRKMAIVNFGGTLQVVQNFTANVDRLKAAATGVAFSAVSPNEPGPALSRDFAARDMIMALRTLAKNLSLVPGRKTLVMLTSGFKLTPEQFSEVTATIDACNKANVAIYPIDVRGLVAAVPVASNYGGAGGGLLGRFQPPVWLGPALSLSFAPQRGGATTGGTPGGGAPGGGASAGGAGGSVGGARGGIGGGAPAGSAGGPGGSPGSVGGTRGSVAPGVGGRGGGPGSYPGGNSAPPQSGRGAGAMGQPFPGLNPYNQSRSLIPKIPESTVDNQNVMYMLADGTGGFVIHDSNDLLGSLQKIGKEQNEYYLLGYTPANSEDGSCHVLRVKVDRGGTNVRARTGYCNAKPRDLLAGSPIEKQLETRAAATQPGAVAAPMQLPFFYTSPNVARVNVAMEIPSESIKFEKQKGKLHGEINVLGIANGADGSVAARFSDTVKLDFEDKKEVEAFQKKPLHYENQFDVASGKYNLKVVFNSGDSNFGKIEMPLEVDSYEPSNFSVSGLAWSREAHKTSDMASSLDASLLEDKVPLLYSGLQLIPSGTNEFKKNDLKVFYVEIYEPLLTKPQDEKNPVVVAIVMKILDRKTGEQKSDTGLLRLELDKQGSNLVIALAEKLPADSLAPGSYTLEFYAVDSADNQFKRTADFELR